MSWTNQQKNQQQPNLKDRSPSNSPSLDVGGGEKKKKKIKLARFPLLSDLLRYLCPERVLYVCSKTCPTQGLAGACKIVTSFL